MIVTIKRTLREKNTLINEHKVISGETTYGKNLARALPDGSVAYHEFGGVMDHDDPSECAHKVKLVYITAFQWEINEERFVIPDNSFTLGYLFNDKLYLGIRNDMPLHWSIR